MLKDMKDRVAVVTGGASGIGLGMARAFAAEGMRVVVADIEEEAREGAVAGLRDAGAEVLGVACDVADRKSVEAVRDAALSAFGGVHVVCNNAGVAGGNPAPTWASPQEDWDWVLGVNLMGVVYGEQTFVPIMLEQGQGGHVVNTASLAGLINGGGIYGVSKQAVVGLSESLWRELEETGSGVGASVLCPGWVRTRIFESERNRPEAPRDEVEIPPEVAARVELLKGVLANGEDPDNVGKQVAEAVKNDTFYILTHPNWNNVIEHRFQNILQQRPPTFVAPEGEEGIFGD